MRLEQRGRVMDVKDYSQGLSSTKARYRDAQNELKESYEKNTDDLKKNYEGKLEKQRASYDLHKTELSEQNAINEQRYNDITKKAVTDSQKEYLEDLKESRSTLEQDRARDRQSASEKLSHLRNEYERSTLENSRLHDVAMKNMKERYDKNLNNMEKGFNSQVKSVDERSKDQFDRNRLDSRKSIEQLARKKDSEINELRASGVEDRSKMLGRLKEDNEAQRASFESDLKNLQAQQGSRVKDLMSSKVEESERNQEVFSNLQEQIKKRNAYDQEKIQIEHIKENKNREKKYNDDLRNVQRLADQKIIGGSGGNGLKSSFDNTVKNYEERLFKLKDELSSQSENNVAKENKIDLEYREKIKDLKGNYVQKLERQDMKANKEFGESLENIKKTNDSNLEVIRKESEKSNIAKDELLYKSEKDSKKTIDAQRIEFGKVVNSLNEKNMETLSSLKDDFAKDKSSYIEKSKREHNSDLTALKIEYEKQLELKDMANGKKMEEFRRQAEKVIDSYENKISQIERKTNKEIESLKANSEERNIKEEQAREIEFKAIAESHKNELEQLRNRYESMIYRDRSETEKMVNKIVQKYEDQLGRERIESQKDKNLKLAEAEANLQRLFKATELEKSTLRQQYEDRLNAKDS